jgi:hypothetical protein
VYVIIHNNIRPVGLPWTSGWPAVEVYTCNNTQHLQEKNLHIPGGIRNHDSLKRAVTGLYVLDRATNGMGAQLTKKTTSVLDSRGSEHSQSHQTREQILLVVGLQRIPSDMDILPVMW